MNAIVFKPLLDWWTATLSTEVEKKRVQARRRYAKNPAKYCAEKRAARKQNPEHEKGLDKLRRLKSPEKFRERNRKSYAKNPELYKARTKKYRAENLETVRRKENEKHAKNPEIRRARYAANPKKAQAATAKWLAKDGIKQRNRRVVNGLRTRIREVLNGNPKAATTMKLSGCSIDELCAHLESQFSKRPGMSWETRCFWHIDHIRPCADFPDLSDPEQQRACFHYTNLQPIWAVENLTKHTKYGGSDF